MVSRGSDLGTAVLELTTDNSKLNSGLDDAERKSSSWLKGMGSQAGGAAIALGGVGVAVGAVALGIGSAIGTAADFEHQIDAVGAVAGATTGELKQLNDTGIRIGKDTAFSSLEAAQAMEVLAANGVSATDIINGAADATVALAAAGGTDLVTAADLASTSMAVWGLTTADMTDVVNRMAGAANVSRFGVEDMSLAVAQGGGAAKTAGVDFADFTTAIAATAPYFASGSDAGTSFKTMLMRLSPTTKDAKQAMQDLGIITEDGSNQFYDAQGNLKDFATVTDILHNATKDLSEEQKTQALSTIFGTDAMRAASGIAAMTGDEFRAMSQKMGDTQAADVAAQRMSNAKGAMEQLRGSIESMSISLGSVFLPILTTVAMWLAQNLPTAFDAVGRAMGVLGQHLDIVVPVLAVLGGGVLGLVVAGFIALGMALWSAVVPFLILASPVILVGAAIGGLIAVVALLITNWDTLTQKFPILQSATEAVQGALQGLAAFFTGTLLPALIGVGQAIRDKVQQQWENFTEWVNSGFLPVWSSVVSAVTGAVGAVVSFISANWPRIQPVIQATLDFIKTYVGAIWDEVKTIFQAAMDIIQGILKVFHGLFTGDWQELWDGVKEIASALWDVLKATWQNTVDVLLAAGNVLKEELIAIWNIIKDAVGGVADAIRDWLVDKFTDAKDTVLGIFDAFRDGAAAAWNGIKDAIIGVVSEITSKIESMFRGVVDLVKTIFNGLISAVNGVINRINSALEFSVSIPGVDMPGPIPDIPGVNFSFDAKDIPNIPSLGIGTNYVPRDMLAFLHQGEAVVPKEYNDTGGGRGGDVIYGDKNLVVPNVRLTDNITRILDMAVS